MGQLEEGQTSASSNILCLIDNKGGFARFRVLGAYLSPWQKFPSADKFHDPTIILPNIEIIPPLSAEQIEYRADRFAVGLYDIRIAFRKSEELELYRPYADLIYNCF